MISVSLSRSKRLTRSFISCAAMISFAVLNAAAQQTDQLQQQLQQLKQQYDQTTRDLEQRIAALEQQIQKDKEASERPKEETVSVVELAAEQAVQKAANGQSDQVGAKFQGQVPSAPEY